MEDETLLYAEEDWNEFNYGEFFITPDLFFATLTLQNNRRGSATNYKRFGDAFVVDMMDLRKSMGT